MKKKQVTQECHTHPYTPLLVGVIRHGNTALYGASVSVNWEMRAVSMHNMELYREIQLKKHDMVSQCVFEGEKERERERERERESVCVPGHHCAMCAWV